MVYQGISRSIKTGLYKVKSPKFFKKVGLESVCSLVFEISIKNEIFLTSKMCLFFLEKNMSNWITKLAPEIKGGGWGRLDHVNSFQNC